jgi:hypothetical protein
MALEALDQLIRRFTALLECPFIPSITATPELLGDLAFEGIQCATARYSRERDFAPRADVVDAQHSAGLAGDLCQSTPAGQERANSRSY